MLKEGWDVTNLYTIVPLRAANARTLVEQMIVERPRTLEHGLGAWRNKQPTARPLKPSASCASPTPRLGAPCWCWVSMAWTRYQNPNGQKPRL